MKKKKLDLSLANIDSIIDKISNRFEPEEWLVATAKQIGALYKELRDTLRKHKNAPFFDNRHLLAFHYYNLGKVFWDLLLKHRVDSQSIVQWMGKCLSVLEEIPVHQIKELSSLSKSVEFALNKIQEIRNAVQGSSGKAILVLGDVPEDLDVTEYLNCGGDEKKQIQRILQNITLLRVITFLEDGISNPSNRISATFYSFPLSKAYFVAGIQNLENKFTNTTERLMRNWCLKENATDKKKEMTSLIMKLVKDRRSVQQVVDTIIEHFHNEPLTPIDMDHIERKYSEFCLREFIEESVIEVKKMKEKENRQVIVDILPKLTLCDSLLRVPHPMNELEFYILMKNNYKVITPKDADEALRNLKLKCYESVLECVELVKKELKFLEVFMEFLDGFKDMQYLEKVLDLHHSCLPVSPFGDFVRTLLKLEHELDPRFIAVQEAAKVLRNEDNLFYVKEFKKIICDYLKPPEFQLEERDGRVVLEVRSRRIVMSDILQQEEFNKMLSNPSCEEVRFIGSSVIHVDEDFEQSKWHGKNIVALTNTVFIHGDIVWDVSGNDVTSSFDSPAGTAQSGVGIDGKDGEAGESGGDVLILAESILNPEKLKVISNGGDGGEGQTGGSGLDGAPGKSVNKTTFHSTFPATACYTNASKLKSLRTTIKSIASNYNSYIEKKYYVRQGTVFTDRSLVDVILDLEKSKVGSIIYIEARTEEGQKITFSFKNDDFFSSYCNSHLLFKGSDGKPGFKGGEPGMGGQGGFPGEISVRNTRGFPSRFNISTVVLPGAEGSPGIGGKYGHHGKNGSDIGYLDYMISGWIFHDTWPKHYGLGGNSKIKLKYHEYGLRDSNRVWCPYHEKYMSMEVDPNPNTESISQYQKRSKARSNASRESNSVARRKKAISHSSVLVNYQQQINSMGKAYLSNLYDEINKANDQALLAIEDNQKSQQDISINAQIMRGAVFKRERNRIQDLEEELNVGIDYAANNEDVSNGRYKMMNASNGRYKMIGLQDRSSKDRLVYLLEISRELESGELPNDSPVNSIDIVATMRHLVTGKAGSNEISHTTLGRLDQYIFGNEDEMRKELTNVFKDEFEYNGHLLLDIFKTFIFETGNLEESSVCSNYWYKKYKLLADRKKLGFLVFSESVKKVDKEFISFIFSKKCEDDSVTSEFVQFIMKKGSESVTVLEFLAYTFNVNIRVYTPIKNQKFGYVLKINLNPSCQQCYHLLVDCSNKLTLLDVDVAYQKLENQREKRGVLFSKIISTMHKFSKKEEFVNYLATKAYERNIDEELELLAKPVPVLKTTVDGILQYFPEREKIVLEPRLYKLSPKYLGRTDILENILERFKIEGNHITAQELMCIINSVLRSVAEGNKGMNTYRWIVIAYPQHHWISEILLMDLETFFRRSLQEKKTWRQYLRKIENKAILVMIRDKVRKLNPVKSHSAWCLNEIFRLLSEIPTHELRMGQLDLGVWPRALKEKYWKHRLSSLMERIDDELSTCVYYTLSIENMCGSEIMNKCIQLLAEKKFKIEPTEMSGIFSNFNDGRWTLGEVELGFLSDCSSLHDWKERVERDYLNCIGARKTECLVRLVKENANTSENVKTILAKIQVQLNTVFKSHSCSSILEITDKKSIHEYLESDIKTWVQGVKYKLASFNRSNERKDFLDNMNSEALAVINRGIQLKRDFCLLDTQRLTVMILLENGRSTLAQVATGEGKSLSIVALSIIKALKGEKVDIITSSSVLAKRDAEENADIYKLFGINVSHNCDEDVELRKAAYSGSQIVYGDLSDFQRDYLLHAFYSINILGDRNFGNVVIDEVDSMLLDKGNNMLYLSHDIPWFDKLESIYLYIWQWINRPCCNKDGVLLTFDAKAIKESVLSDLFGRIGKEEIKSLDTSMSNIQAGSIWECLVQHEIIDRKSRPTSDKVDCCQIEEALTPDFKSYTDRLHYLITVCILRDRQIQVPNCLKKFVELHLDMWIANAISAYFMKAGEDYVVDVDRTGTSADRNPNITIIDKNTGTDQVNTQWVEALHQFLQLKHNCKLSFQNLKAVFISNVSYFKLYGKLYGLTGTIGLRGERELLKDVHEVDFVTIPTAKPKQFNELLPTVCSDEGAWIKCIQKESERFVLKDKRSVLIICDSVNDAEVLYRTLKVNTTLEIHKYTREYEEFDIIQRRAELSPGHIIIATNLAGRGTDIKIDSELKLNGGLHVILSYLPNNARIEQQAFGRTARCGDKGSGQLIFKDNEVNSGASFITHLKNKRDLKELERLSEIKLYYENQISAEEKCFLQFKDQYIILMDQIKKRVDVKEVQDILLRSCIDKWAFWLDENGGLISDLSESKSSEALDESLNKFISQLTCFKYDTEDWISWVDHSPVAKIKLAKHFFRQRKFDTAITLFDSVIETEPNFSAAAHYYKAGALGGKINWTSKSEEDRTNKCIFENELIQAAKLFEQLENETMKKSAIVGKMKCSNRRGILQIEGYEEQSKNIANIYKVFSLSIDDILGHAVRHDSFLNYNIKDTLAYKLQQHFLGDKTLNHSSVLREKMSQSEMEVLSSDYGISVSQLDDFLIKWDHETINSYRDFIADMKKHLCLPSREKLWKELLRMNFLTDEVKYLIVNDKKLGEIDPSLLDSLRETCRSKRKHELVKEEGYLFLNELCEEDLGIVLLKDEFINQIGKERYLALKSGNVFDVNKKCRLHVLSQSDNKYFTSYDSISVQDFVRNKVSEKDAVKVLHELVDQQIIMRRQGDGYYRLATDFSKINNISLTCSVYEPVTKSLLHTCFAYRIAFQKITSQDDDGYTLKLIKKPYIKLFWDLYNLKVINPIKLSKGKHSVDSVQRSLSLTFDKADFTKLLDECVPCEDSEDLIKQMISKNWLKEKKTWRNVVKLEIKRLDKENDEEWKPLCQKYGTCEKTLKKTLNDLLELSQETTRISHCLDRLKSNLDNLDVPSFALKPLKEAVADRDISYAQEMYHFISNDLEEILILEEKKYTRRMIVNTAVVICLGICQIAVGIIIDLFSFGSLSMLANGISEGFNDIMYALNALSSGIFSWADYGKQKLMSLFASFMTAGMFALGSYLKTAKSFLSRVGNKLFGAVLIETPETVGAQLLQNSRKIVVKEIATQCSLKTLEGIGFGVANITIDTVVNNVLHGLCDETAKEIIDKFDSEWKSHRITLVLRKAFEVLGENDACARTLNLTKTLLEKPSEWDKWRDLAGEIVICFAGYIREEMANEENAGPLAWNLNVHPILHWVYQRLSCTRVWVDRLIHLKEVEKLTAQLLDKLANDFDGIIRDSNPVEAQADSNYERFEKNAVKHMKSQIVEKINQILSDIVFDPLLEELPPALVRYHHERHIKDFYRNAKGGDIELFREYNSHYEKSILHDRDDLPAISTPLDEYNANLLLLLSKTRNLELFSEIIREKVPMDMTCLQAFINMLPHILRRLGVQERIRIVVEDYGDDVAQVFASSPTEEGVERVIRLRVKNSKFEAVGRDRTWTRQRDSLNIIGLYWALSEHLDLGMSEDQFRSSTAKMVKEVQEIQSIIKKDWHLNGISLKMHGEAHPYDHDDWSFDPQVDIDLCRGEWVVTEYGNRWEEHILTREELHGQYTEAYTRTLQRINEIVTGKSANPHWSDCKLIKPHRRIRPHDFEATKYDTIRAIKGLGSIGIAFYPVEIKSEIRVERDPCEVKCYKVVIHTEGVSPGQRGPQGPHIGYSISCSNSQGPNLVSGHCLINSVGNEHLPRRRKNAFEKDITYHSDCRIPVRKLFYKPNQLERADKKNPPIERFRRFTIKEFNPPPQDFSLPRIRAVMC